MKYAIALVLLAVELAGCSGRPAAWPWNKPQGVPLTKPTSQDANVVFADAPAKSPLMSPDAGRGESVAGVQAPKSPAAAPVAPAPAASAPTPAAAQSPLMSPDAGRGESAGKTQSLDKPMDLTELLNPPKVEPKLVEVAPIMAPSPVGRPAKPARPTPPPAAPKSPLTSPDAGPDESAGKTQTPKAAQAIIASAKNPLMSPSPSRDESAASVQTPVGSTPPTVVVAASVVQVNRRFITIDDILRPLAAKLSKLPKGISEQTFRDQAAGLIAQEITGQITRVLVVEEAEKRLVDDQKKAIDQEVKQAQSDMLAAAGGSVTQLRQQLQREGLTLEQAMDDYRRDATFKLYLRHRFMPAIPVTRKMLWDYYCQNSQQFSAGHKVQMQIIAEPFIEFLADPAARPSTAELAAAKTQARREIEAAKARLDAGDDFAEVAKKYSRDIKAPSGGLWPMMQAGSFKETEVEKAALQLPSGGVSAPVETPHGWYIVKAVQVIPGRIVPFEEAQDQIAEILRTRMYNDLTDKYFQDLLEKSHIVRSPQFNELALDRAADRFWNK